MMNVARLVVFAIVLSTPWVAEAVEMPDPAKLKLASANALVYEPGTGRAIYQKGADDVTPIASVTKLMTAMVVLDANLPLDEPLAVDIGDFDMLKGSGSRLSMGVELPRREMLRLALMASENRAASTLARHYPGGSEAFVAAMNAKAASLGMTRSHFDDSTGLSPSNVSTARDLAKMVEAAAGYPLIREFSVTPSYVVEVQPTGRVLGFNNSNRLVQSSEWDIQLQKTGYIREAGRCLVMQTQIAGRKLIMVFLDSAGKLSRIGDAVRVRNWVESMATMHPSVAGTVAARKS